MEKRRLACIERIPRKETGKNGVGRLRIGCLRHSGVPPRHRRSPVLIQNFGPHLQQEIGTALSPPHQLSLNKSLAENLVDAGLDKGGRDGFSMAVTVAVVRSECSVGPDEGFEFSNRFQQLPLLLSSDLRRPDTPVLETCVRAIAQPTG